MEALLDVVEREARTLLDKIQAREIRIQAYIVKDRGEDALRVALAHLGDLGESASRNPTAAEVLLDLARTRLALGRKLRCRPDDLGCAVLAWPLRWMSPRCGTEADEGGCG